jgi:nucleotide-binding universal stress UspA family protein
MLTAIASGSLAHSPQGDLETEELNTIIDRMLAAAADIVRLRAPDIAVSTQLQQGEPKHVLVEEAERWGADCIFVGSRGLNRLERLLFGSVATAVATRASCSVEVVRPTSAQHS